MKHLQKGQELLEKRRFNTAAFQFERAVEGCESQRAVDLDVECEALRGRAMCWLELKEYRKLTVDAERLLEIDAADIQAQEWQRVAAEAASLLESRFSCKT